MKKIIALLLTAIMAVGLLAACGSTSNETTAATEANAETTAAASLEGAQFGIPNDPTNEARALELLQKEGLITLKNTGDVEATIRDIEENPYGIEFVEIEAAQLPQQLASLDYAVINSNYAIDAGLTPFLTEGTDVAYPNVIVVAEENKDADLTKALVAAANSKKVEDFINEEYAGAVVSDLVDPTEDGKDATVDYTALQGQKITIAASPAPHADILKVVKEVLEENGIELEIIEYNDYVQPNMVVENGEVYANYFQHQPYLDNFNAENNTHLVSVLSVHHEPMGIYSDKYDSLDPIK